MVSEIKRGLNGDEMSSRRLGRQSLNSSLRESRQGKTGKRSSKWISYGLNAWEVGVCGLDGMWATSRACIRSRKGELSEGSGLEASGFVRNEVLRRRTGPGPDASETSAGNSSAGSCERSAISHVFNWSEEDSIAEIQGSRSKAMAVPNPSKRQSVRVQ